MYHRSDSVNLTELRATLRHGVKGPLKMASLFVKLMCLLASALVIYYFFTRLDVIIRWKPRRIRDTVYITFVSCGSGIEESVVMMKSVIMFSRAPIVFHIFTEEKYMEPYKDVWRRMPEDIQDRIQFIVHEVSFPKVDDGAVDEWMKLCKPCSSQRLFIHELLPDDVDSVIYVDTDTLFLYPVEEFWESFKKFNQYQLAGMSLEQEHGEPGFYDKHPEIPHYGEKGVNAGVLLMNLTRIRASSWLKEIVANYGKYKSVLKLGDQDLLNIFFHRFPELLYVFPCEWNYRADHCNKTSTCLQAEATGARLMHGSSEIWFTDDQPAFKAVYETVEKHPLTTPSTVSLISNMYDNILTAPTSSSNCGQVLSKFTWYLFNNAIDGFSVFLNV